MSFIVQAQGISKTFAAPAGGRLHALREVSLQARAGQLTALVGPAVRGPEAAGPGWLSAGSDGPRETVADLHERLVVPDVMRVTKV